MANYNPFEVKTFDLSGFGKIADAFGQKRRDQEAVDLETQKKEAAQQTHKEAFRLLNESGQAQDPAERERLFMEAYQMAPKMVQGFIETSKKQQAGDEAITPFQAETLDIKRATLEVRKDETEARKMDQKLSRETNELKRDELKQKLEAKKVKIEQSKKAIGEAAQDKIAVVKSTLDTLNRVRNHPGLESAAGISSMFPTVAGSDAANFEAELGTLQSQQFLSAVEQMKGLGALSEAEGRKITAAIGALDLSMSDKALKKELDRIYEVTSKAMRKLEGRLPKGVSATPETPAPQGALDYLRQNPQTIDQFEAQYGYRPEGI